MQLQYSQQDIIEEIKRISWRILEFNKNFFNKYTPTLYYLYNNDYNLYLEDYSKIFSMFVEADELYKQYLFDFSNFFKMLDPEKVRKEWGLGYLLEKYDAKIIKKNIFQLEQYLKVEKMKIIFNLDYANFKDQLLEKSNKTLHEGKHEIGNEKVVIINPLSLRYDLIDIIIKELAKIKELPQYKYLDDICLKNQPYELYSLRSF